VAAHDLDDEGALVGGGGGGELVDGVDDAVQRRVRADGHVGADHVVIDGADQSDDDQGGVGPRGLLGDGPLGGQLLNVLRPFPAELVGAGQGSVAADDDEVVDAVLQQVAGGGVAARVLTEGGAARGPDDGPALGEDRRHVGPPHLLDGAPAVDGALPSLHDRVGRGAARQGGADYGAHRRVHSLGVAARGEDSDACGGLLGERVHVVPFHASGGRPEGPLTSPLYSTRVRLCSAQGPLIRPPRRAGRSFAGVPGGGVGELLGEVDREA
jgi:hypothetical protein